MAERNAPVYFVAVRKAGERSESLDLSNKVLSLSFTDAERKADKLMLTVDNFDLSNFDDPIWAHGNIIEFSYGYSSDLAPVREAVIRKVTGGTTLTIEAHSKDVIMDRLKRRLSYDNVKRSDVVRQIAIRNGYVGESAIIEDTKEIFPLITQSNLTDAQMLRKLANLEGYEFFVDFDGLHWHRRDVEQAPIRNIEYYYGPESEVIGFTVDNDITRRPGRVRVRSKNPLTKEKIVATADNETDGIRGVLQEVTAVSAIVIDEVTGEIERIKKEISGVDPTAYDKEVPSNARTQEEAQTEATWRYRKATQRAVEMTLQIVGDPGILAKSVLSISGFSKRLSGKYYVREVINNLGGGSPYLTTLKLITDGYQRKYGSKGGKGEGASSAASEAGLRAAINQFQISLQPVGTNSAKQAGAAAIASANAALQAGLTKKSLLAASTKAITAVSVIKQAARGASGSEREALVSARVRAAALASLLKRVASQEDRTANGKLNTKEVADSRQLQQRLIIDEETGERRVVFVDTKARGQK